MLDEPHPEVERWRATVEQATALPFPKVNAPFEGAF
jgi:hypothetical protein